MHLNWTKKEDRIMKTRHIIPAILLVLAACQQMELEQPTPETNPEEVQQAPDSLFTLTVQATKGEADTKALDLTNEGATLGAYWKDTEKVKVYKEGTLLGTLDVTPASGEKPTSATLSGSITTTGLSEGNTLTLMIPRETWSYTGQTGTLTGTGSIEDTYDYATAAVTIASISGSTVTTTGSANFQNQQSVYRFGFKLSGSYIDPKDFTVSAAGGLLVQSLSYEGSAWTPQLGPLTITPASAPADHFYYVALRNGSTAADTYNFILTSSDDKLYMASKGIPASVLDAPGKFISAKNITAVQPAFSPADATTDTAL